MAPLTLTHIALLTRARIEPPVTTDPPRITRLTSPDAAGPDALCFVRPSWRGALSPDAGALVVEGRPLDGFSGPQLIVASIDEALPRLLDLFAPELPAWDAADAISPTATVAADVQLAPGVLIGPEATVASGCWLGPGVVVEPRAEIGPGCRIEANAVIGWGCVVAARCRVGRGAVIGAEGFGFDARGARLPHVGRVVLEEDVEVGAQSVIDRATLGETRIGAGCRLDNLVHVAHNVRLGPRCMVAAQVGIAGSARIGAGVMVGGQAGVVGHVVVGDGARLAARAGVVGDVAAGATVAGLPAVDIGIWRRASVALRRLPELVTRLRRLEGEGGADE